ncbi:MAG: hypothetical protein HOW73_28625 [Polyangiaceae bacterium]|nr:hypothetical protein [Polyangiaceae bacterium]
MTAPTDAQRALAASLVDEALQAYQRTVPRRALRDVREFMIDELLCTSYGRAKLARLLDSCAHDSGTQDTNPDIDATDETTGHT